MKFIQVLQIVIFMMSINLYGQVNCHGGLIDVENINDTLYVSSIEVSDCSDTISTDYFYMVREGFFGQPFIVQGHTDLIYPVNCYPTTITRCYTVIDSTYQAETFESNVVVINCPSEYIFDTIELEVLVFDTINTVDSIFIDTLILSDTLYFDTLVLNNTDTLFQLDTINIVETITDSFYINLPPDTITLTEYVYDTDTVYLDSINTLQIETIIPYECDKRVCEIRVFPNPAVGEFTLDVYLPQGNADIVIHNNGTIVYEGTVISGQLNYNLNLETGFYTIDMYYEEDGKTYIASTKLIIL